MADDKKLLKDSFRRVIFDVFAVMCFWIIFSYIISIAPPLDFFRYSGIEKNYTKEFLSILRNVVFLGIVGWMYFDVKDVTKNMLVSLHHQGRIDKTRLVSLDTIVGLILIIVFLIMIYNPIIGLIEYIWQVSNFNFRYISYAKDLVNLSYIIVIIYIIYRVIAAFFFEAPSKPKSTKVKKESDLMALLNEKYLNGKVTKEQYLKYKKEIEEMESGKK